MSPQRLGLLLPRRRRRWRAAVRQGPWCRSMPDCTRSPPTSADGGGVPRVAQRVRGSPKARPSASGGPRLAVLAARGGAIGLAAAVRGILQVQAQRTREASPRRRRWVLPSTMKDSAVAAPESLEAKISYPPRRGPRRRADPPALRIRAAPARLRPRCLPRSPRDPGRSAQRSGAAISPRPPRRRDAGDSLRHRCSQLAHPVSHGVREGAIATPSVLRRPDLPAT